MMNDVSVACFIRMSPAVDERTQLFITVDITEIRAFFNSTIGALCFLGNKMVWE